MVAHAFGKRYDLPVPLWLFVIGGAAVVFVSFLVVLPRAVAPASAGEARFSDRIRLRRPAPVRWIVAGLIAVALMLCGWFGSSAVAENIVPSFFWLAVWVATPISCGLLGDWTRAVNPFAALARACDRPGLRSALLGDERVVGWPRRLGWWPAVAFFFTVACGELIFNGTATLPAFTAWGLLVYALVNALAGLLFGARAWTERGEVFSVLFATWGRLGWFRFGADGERGFGGGLRVPFDAHVSRVTFVLLLLVSVSFDGLLSTPAWKTFRAQITLSGIGFQLFETAAFAVLVLVAWGLFGGFAALVRHFGDMQRSNLQVLAGLVPSLLPIAFGYLVAHNAEYIAINGQLFIPLLGNPAGMDGVHLLPAPFNDSYEINPNLLPSSVVWYLQVALIIVVHIAAVVLAHRYLARASRSHAKARASEWPWIVAMVGYTMTSLWLLAQPLVQ
ncbi:MAG: hypothetical protein DLM65_01425 [Candidatus Aeolococcus gillhamiae]|uniref:Fenitrothion hydrolase n=1 Tax=Candidatus Aeolococcus gillhamiae TaxID=3127015 RepID=A0A2W5ZKV9_9BACT|nr:MAG: hypothetical protein DLM65_01425 [Candidatus Dormibacter sp. RRmetagenome_bin12]